jgi:hypothetical protein
VATGGAEQLGSKCLGETGLRPARDSTFPHVVTITAQDMKVGKVHCMRATSDSMEPCAPKRSRGLRHRATVFDKCYINACFAMS